MKIKFIFLALVLLTLITSPQTFGQNNPEEPFIALSNDSGENASLVIDLMLNEAKRNGDRLFVIVRPSKNDTFPTVALSRLRAAKTHLTVIKEFDSKHVVFAVGEETQSEGKVDFYSGSRLRLVLLAARNKIPNFTCCEPYFPPAKRKAR